MTFFEWLASNEDGYHEGTRTFIVFASTSLLAFGVLLATTGRLVLDALKALSSEHGRTGA